jgi:hypothetical protein
MKAYSITSRRWGFYRKMDVNFPEKLGECSPAQFVEISKMAGIADPSFEDKVLLLSRIINIPRWAFRKLTAEQLEMFLVDAYLLSTDTLTDKWFIKSIKIKNNILYGPNDQWMNLCFGEFIYADTAFICYMQKPDNNFLNKLIAALYRPMFYTKMYDPYSTGDHRQPYNEYLIEDLSKAIERVAPLVKNAILYNYSIMRKQIEKMYPNVFPKSTEKESKSKSKHTGSWTTIVLNIAPNVINVKDVEQLPMHLVLTDLDEKIKRDKKNNE